MVALLLVLAPGKGELKLPTYPCGPHTGFTLLRLVSTTTGGVNETCVGALVVVDDTEIALTSIDLGAYSEDESIANVELLREGASYASKRRPAPNDLFSVDSFKASPFPPNPAFPAHTLS